MYYINYDVLKKYLVLIIKFKKKNFCKYVCVMIVVIFGFMYFN